MLVKVTEEIIEKACSERDMAMTNNKYFSHASDCVIAQAAMASNDEPETKIVAGFGWLYRYNRGGVAFARAMMSDEAVAAVLAFDKNRYEELKPFEFEVEWMPY